MHIRLHNTLYITQNFIGCHNLSFISQSREKAENKIFHSKKIGDFSTTCFYFDYHPLGFSPLKYE